MKKYDYLKHSFKEKRILEVDWWVRAFTDFIETPNPPTAAYSLVRQPWGCSVVLPSGELEKLEDYSGKGPVFTIHDEVVVTPEWMANVDTDIKSMLGIALANSIMVAESFGKKIPYINGEVDVGKIENKIASKMQSNPPPGVQKDPNQFYVDDWLSMSKGSELITTVMELFAIGLTQKTLLPPPGIDKERARLLKEHNYDLNDPIQLADYESKLLKFDAEYLQGDPSLGKFASGKILKDSRKKLYLSQGAEGGFSKNGSIVGVPTSLSQGMPKDPKQYVATVNGSRSGSFSRGHETMEGGVAAKKMLAASNNYIIEDTDCGSTMGHSRIYTPWLINSLKGRTIINGKSQEKVPEDADVSMYLGKKIRARSPMYCRLDGERICKVCAGDSMARFGTGIAIPLTEISHAILTARMKAMHTNSLTVNKFDIKTLFS